MTPPLAVPAAQRLARYSALLLSAFFLAGCTVDLDGTGELLGAPSDASTDPSLAEDGPPGSDADAADGKLDSGDLFDAVTDGPAHDVDASEPDAPLETGNDAPDDAMDADDVSVADVTDCDATSGGCDAGMDSGDASDDGAEGSVNICDQDSDGEFNSTCGGADCCDTDPRVHTGQADWFAAPHACGNYDYNCDSQQELRWTSTGESCHLCWVFSCCVDDGDYLSGPPGCGDAAEVGGCGGWPDCDNDGDSRTQMCR